MLVSIRLPSLLLISTLVRSNVFLCSARDENEIGMCMKDMNSPAYHPTMISLWVTDSFERKDKERDLLAKLLVNLVKSADNALNEVQLVKG